MSAHECVREHELLECIQSGRWPDKCPEDLRTHVQTCAICTDAVEVALALRDDYEAAWANARVPSAGLVWWRAELRARQEAVRTVSRPMTVVQSLGAACAAGVSLALLSRAWPLIEDIGTLATLLFVALALLLVAPLAMYLVLSDK